MGVTKRGNLWRFVSGGLAAASLAVAVALAGDETGLKKLSCVVLTVDLSGSSVDNPAQVTACGATDKEIEDFVLVELRSKIPGLIVKTTTEKDCLNILSVQLGLVRPEEVEVYAIGNTLALHRVATVLDTNEVQSVVVWQKGRHGVAGRDRCHDLVQEQLGKEVLQFAADYYRANPQQGSVKEKP